MKHHNLYIIGLTGNIACGKSTVLDLLRERGAQVLDADRVTHELQAPGQPVYHAIVAEFGPAILSAPAGPIDAAWIVTGVRPVMLSCIAFVVAL